MTTYQFANNASTTLGSAISPTATSVTVAAGTGAQFPNPGAGQYFTATLFASATGIPNEIVRVTSRTGDTMTVVRGQEGTTAQSWSVGDVLANFVTAGFLNQLVDASSLQGQAGNYAADTGSANAAVATLVPAPANLAALTGVPVRVKKIGTTNTGAFTINLNSLGAVSVLIGGQLLEGGEVAASEVFEVVYDGSKFDLISNPGKLHGSRLAANTVPNAGLAVVGASTLKGNLGDAAATPYDVPLATLLSVLGLATGGAVTSGNTSFHLSMKVQGIPSPLIIQGGKVINAYSNPILCSYAVELTTVVLMAGGVAYTNSTTGIHDEDNFSGIAGTPGLGSLLYAVSRGGGDQPIAGCYWWVVGY